MKKIPKKNYIILVILLISTVFLTLFLANIYSSKDRLVSSFYENTNKIKIEEFDGYIIENPDAIIYISDKYDLTNEKFEEKFHSKIDSLSLNDKIVYIDKKEIQEKFLSNLKNNYNTVIDLSKTPIVMVIVDKKVMKVNYITEDTNIDTFINYEVFE